MSEFALTPLSWPEGEPNLGEGVSRPTARARAKTYSILVRFSQAKPMKATIKAESQRHALKYAKNRWPLATIEILK